MKSLSEGDGLLFVFSDAEGDGVLLVFADFDETFDFGGMIDTKSYFYNNLKNSINIF
jgi:hypothetical protein